MIVSGRVGVIFAHKFVLVCNIESTLAALFLTEMKVTFLGTGASHGIPIVGCKCSVCQSVNPKDKRLRSSIYIETEGRHILVDP